MYSSICTSSPILFIGGYILYDREEHPIYLIVWKCGGRSINLHKFNSFVRKSSDTYLE